MFKILIVEDNNVFRHTLKDLLAIRFPEISISEAKDEKEALKKIESFCPNLIFMDMNLQGRNGLEIIKKKRESSKELVIIVFTSHDLPEYKQQALHNGADHFLSKYYSSPQEIFSLVESVASQRKRT